MADQFSNEGPSTLNTLHEGQASTIELNIKTLDSQIYSFQVDKNMTVSAFKEKIANDIGVPVGQLRLIFRGRVLKDEHCLSEYQVENGHTLHLVARQTDQSQSSAATSSGGTNANNSNQGNDAVIGGSQNRIGQIAHSVLLGTFNVGNQGEGIVPDVSRVIGAVLNSLVLGPQTPSGVVGMLPPTAASQGNETGAPRGSVGDRNQAGNQPQSGPSISSQSPLNAPVPLPSFNAPIPDSLSTLSVFMSNMEQTLARNGYQPNTSSANAENIPTVALPSNSRGFATAEALSIVLRHAERLLSGHAVAAISHIAGRLQQEGSYSDANTRGQIQSDSVQLGLAMQHLGALFLELGRTILTLRVGQSIAESVVNAGPAVYISPSGPNPIMVQPFPLQANSLFGSSVPTSNPLAINPVGVGSAPRHVNIHIHAGTTLAPMMSNLGPRASNAETASADHNGNGAGGSGSVGVQPMRTVIATTVPRSTGVGVSNGSQSGSGVSVPPHPQDLSSMLADINSRVRSLSGNVQVGNQNPQGSFVSATDNVSGNSMTNTTAVAGSEESAELLPEVLSLNNHQEIHEGDNGASGSESKESYFKDEPFEKNPFKSEGTSENALDSNEMHDLPDGTKADPLGLGLGGLKLKKRVKKLKPQSRSSNTRDATVSQISNNVLSGQQLLQSLASRASAVTDSERVSQNRPFEEQGSDNQLGIADAMSQVLQSPALNGLLAGVSEQTGAGSPNVLQTMLQQLTQNPQIMSTVSQIAQQVDSQDLDNMFSDLGGGQGSNIDLSRMVQQMMPVVSRVLGSGSATHQPFPVLDTEPQLESNGRSLIGTENRAEEIDLREASQRIEHFDTPANVFRAVVETAVRLDGTGSSPEEIGQHLSNDEDLVRDYMEMLQHDINQRIQGRTAPDKC